jgi:hypothetical protein
VAAALHLERHARRAALRLQFAHSVAAAARLGAAGPGRRDHRGDRLRRGCHGRVVRRGADREPHVGRLPSPRLAGAGRGGRAALRRPVVVRRGLAAGHPRADAAARPVGVQLARHRRRGAPGVRRLRRHRPRHPVARPLARPAARPHPPAAHRPAARRRPGHRPGDLPAQRGALPGAGQRDELRVQRQGRRHRGGCGRADGRRAVRQPGVPGPLGGPGPAGPQLRREGPDAGGPTSGWPAPRTSAIAPRSPSASSSGPAASTGRSSSW